MLIFLYIFSPSAPSGHLPHQREALDCTANLLLDKLEFEAVSLPGAIKMRNDDKNLSCEGCLRALPAKSELEVAVAS